MQHKSFAGFQKELRCDIVYMELFVCCDFDNENLNEGEIGGCNER